MIMGEQIIAIERPDLSPLLRAVMIKSSGDTPVMDLVPVPEDRIEVGPDGIGEWSDENPRKGFNFGSVTSCLALVVGEPGKGWVALHLRSDRDKKFINEKLSEIKQRLENKLGEGALDKSHIHLIGGHEPASLLMLNDVIEYLNENSGGKALDLIVSSDIQNKNGESNPFFRFSDGRMYNVETFRKKR